MSFLVNAVKKEIPIVLDEHQPKHSPGLGKHYGGRGSEFLDMTADQTHQLANKVFDYMRKDGQFNEFFTRAPRTCERQAPDVFSIPVGDLDLTEKLKFKNPEDLRKKNQEEEVQHINVEASFDNKKREWQAHFYPSSTAQKKPFNPQLPLDLSCSSGPPPKLLDESSPVHPNKHANSAYSGNFVIKPHFEAGENQTAAAQKVLRSEDSPPVAELEAEQEMMMAPEGMTNQPQLEHEADQNTVNPQHREAEQSTLELERELQP